MTTPDITLICGPTAVGKSSKAIALAQQTGAEIISADAYQVYRGMDIGTAKVMPNEQEGVPHHLIDILTPDEPYSVSEFLDHCDAAIQAIRSKGKPIILCGGTGFYVNAFLYGMDFHGIPTSDAQLRQHLEAEAQQKGSEALFKRLEQEDPESAARIGPHNTRRIIRALEILDSSQQRPSELMRRRDTPREDVALEVMTLERDTLVERIHQRVDHMIEAGLVDEVRQLLTMYSPDLPAFRAIGYREVIDYINGAFNHDEMVEWIKAHTRQFARRQMTWFKKYR